MQPSDKTDRCSDEVSQLRSKCSEDVFCSDDYMYIRILVMICHHTASYKLSVLLLLLLAYYSLRHVAKATYIVGLYTVYYSEWNQLSLHNYHAYRPASYVIHVTIIHRSPVCHHYTASDARDFVLVLSHVQAPPNVRNLGVFIAIEILKASNSQMNLRTKQWSKNYWCVVEKWASAGIGQRERHHFVQLHRGVVS